MKEKIENYLKVDTLLDQSLSIKARRFYGNLLKNYCKVGSATFPLDYKHLKIELGYSRSTLRNAIKELEKNNIVKREMKLICSKNINVKVNEEYIRNLF